MICCVNETILISTEDPETILEEIIEEGGSENSADQYDGPPKGDRRFLDTLWSVKET